MKFKSIISVPLIISITIAANGFITLSAASISLINSVFELNINTSLPYGIYDLGLGHSIGLGIIMPLLLGYLMIVIAKGLYQRKRLYWILACTFITLAMIADQMHEHKLTSNFIFIFHAIEVILLIIFMKEFNQKSYHRITFYQFILAITFLLAIFYGVLGVYYMRAQFNGVHDITDALYFTFVTFSTVGYGDITPITPEAKYFTISVMVLGIGFFATIVTVLAGSVINKITDKFKYKNGVSSMNNHTVICGYTEVTKCLLKEYSSNLQDIIIIDKDHQNKFTSLSSRYENNFINADSHDTDALTQANILKAKAIFILNDSDSENILTLLTIKELLKNVSNKNLKISIKLDKDENINIAQNIGVDQIVSPTKEIVEKLINKQ